MDPGKIKRAKERSKFYREHTVFSCVRFQHTHTHKEPPWRSASSNNWENEGQEIKTGKSLVHWNILGT